MSKENYREALEKILAPFLTANIRIKSKELYLSKTTKNAIEKSLELVEKAKEEDITLPESVVNLARYGPKVEKLLQNKTDFLKTKQKRRLSKRAGSWELKITSWNQRKIVNYLKRTNRVPVNSSPDNVLVKQHLLELKKKITDTKAVELEEIVENFQEFQKFYLIENSIAYQKIETVRNLLNRIKSAKSEIDKLNTKYASYKEKIQEIKKKRNRLESEKREKRSSWAESKVGVQLQELSDSQNSIKDEIDDYLKFLLDLTHNLRAHIEKQSQEPAVPLGALIALEKNIFDPSILVQQNLESLFQEFLRNRNLFASKNWFKDKTANSDFKAVLINKKKIKKWQKGREIEKEIQKIRKSDSYQNLHKRLDEIDNLLHDLHQEQKELEKKIDTIEETLEIYAERKNTAWQELKDYLNKEAEENDSSLEKIPVIGKLFS